MSHIVSLIFFYTYNTSENKDLGLNEQVHLTPLNKFADVDNFW